MTPTPSRKVRELYHEDKVWVPKKEYGNCLSLLREALEVIAGHHCSPLPCELCKMEVKLRASLNENKLQSP